MDEEKIASQEDKGQDVVLTKSGFEHFIEKLKEVFGNYLKLTGANLKKTLVLKEEGRAGYPKVVSADGKKEMRLRSTGILFYNFDELLESYTGSAILFSSNGYISVRQSLSDGADLAPLLVGDAKEQSHAATKGYVDDLFKSIINGNEVQF